MTALSFESAVRGAPHPHSRRGPLGSGTWCGVPVTSRERMAFDLVARHGVEAGASHLDAAARQGSVDLPALASWLEGRHDDDVVAAREACALADPRAESPPESVCRVRLLRAGFAVVPQHRVCAGQRFVARVDLALVDRRIAIEHDGRWHGALAAQLDEDRRRLNALREAGWIVVHVTAATLAERGALEDAVHRAVRQRSAVA